MSMPVTMNEPLSALQRLCEELQYAELLNEANELEDPYDRMVQVAAFAVSAYSGTQYRAGNKPFNPILGETYECVREDKGFKFVAEQVCVLWWWRLLSSQQTGNIARGVVLPVGSEVLQVGCVMLSVGGVLLPARVRCCQLRCSVVSWMCSVANCGCFIASWGVAWNRWRCAFDQLCLL